MLSILDRAVMCVTVHYHINAALLFDNLLNPLTVKAQHICAEFPYLIFINRGQLHGWVRILLKMPMSALLYAIAQEPYGHDEQLKWF